MKNLTGTKNVWVNALVISAISFIVVCIFLILSNLDKADSFSFNL